MRKVVGKLGGSSHTSPVVASRLPRRHWLASLLLVRTSDRAGTWKSRISERVNGCHDRGCESEWVGIVLGHALDRREVGAVSSPGSGHNTPSREGAPGPNGRRGPEIPPL